MYALILNSVTKPDVLFIIESKNMDHSFKLLSQILLQSTEFNSTWFRAT